MSVTLVVTATLLTACTARPTADSAATPATGGVTAPPPKATSPAAGPSAEPGGNRRLMRAPLAYDAQRKTVVAFSVQAEGGGPDATLWEWTGSAWSPHSVAAVPARSSALLAADPSTHGVLLFGTSVTPPPPSSPPCTPTGPTSQPTPCLSYGVRHATLPDAWILTGTSWRSVDTTGAPQLGLLAATVPAGVAVIGVTLADRPSPSGTWTYDGKRWSKLADAPDAPDGAATIAYDPLSQRLIAYDGGVEDLAPPGSLRPDFPAYTRSWALTGHQWTELHLRDQPTPARGTLVGSAGGRSVLLINELGETWTLGTTGWRRLAMVKDIQMPTARPNTVSIAAASNPVTGDVVAVLSGPDIADETWTLHEHRWTRHDAP